MGTEQPIGELDVLQLTKTGWRRGRAHRVEIWFVQHAGRYYLCSERGERAHWVQNIRRRPEVSITMAGRTLTGRGRALAAVDDAALIAAVRHAFEAKYGWGDGLIVEIAPDRSG